MATGSPVQGYPVNAPIGSPAAPVIPGAAPPIVQGFPVNPGPVNTGSVTPASLAYPVPGPLQPHGAPRAPAPIDLSRAGKAQVKVAAIVGANNLITEQEVEQAVLQRQHDYRDLPSGEREKRVKEIYREELANLIERELIIDELFTQMKKGKASTDDLKEEAAKVAEDQIRSIWKAQGLRTEAEFTQMLEREGISMPVFKRAFERRNMMQIYVSSMMKETGKAVKPGFSEIHAYYDKHPDDFRVEDRVRWQDVFVSIGRYGSFQEARSHAEQLHQQAISGADFIGIIKAEERSPKGRLNWDGIGTRREDVPPDVSEMVFALKPGQISPVIETPTGFHIIKVLEREYAGLRPLDEKTQADCMEKIRIEYSQKESRKMVEGMWRKATIQVLVSP